MNELQINDRVFINDIRNLILDAKTRVALAINSQMTMLYWNVGKRIKEEIIKSDRAEYSKGFSRSNLLYMMKFYVFRIFR